MAAKLSIDNAPFLGRDSGLPVEGRIKVFLHDSDVLARVYTLEGQAYVEAANPQLIHTGYPDASLFVDVGLYDIVVEKYFGTEGEMSVDSPDSDFVQMATYEFGLDMDIDSMTRNEVDTIDELRSTDPSMHCVRVLWYSEPGDCVPRTYVWDPDSVNQEDGGYVIGSDISDSGRWILVWGDEILPASIYGCKPGDESNIPLLINYPATVGSFALRTAPCVRFQAGDWQTSVGLATDKELCFDGGARFVASEITCPRIRVFGTFTSYIADFTFTDTSTVAHSSWFKTVFGFLNCHSKHLTIDATNFFAGTNLGGPVDLEGVTWEANGRLPVTYINSGKIRLSRCNFIGEGFFDGTDKVTFSYTAFKDTWFSVGPNIDFVNKVWVRSTSLNTLLVSNFAYALNYVNALKADGARECDLEGRFVQNLNLDGFQVARNVQCGTLSMETQADLALYNVTADSATLRGLSNGSIGLSRCDIDGLMVFNCRYFDVQDSSVRFAQAGTMAVFTATNSTVGSDNHWTYNTQMSFDRCKVDINVKNAVDNSTVVNSIEMHDCRIGDNCVFETKNLFLYGCTTYHATIKIYPYLVNGSYRLSAIFEGCVFDNSTPIEFTKFDVLDGWQQEDCYDCSLNWRIVGNSFAGNSEGIRMRYWSFRAGNYPLRTFVKVGQGIHNVEYSGNTGSCPGVDFKGVMISDNSAYVTYDLGGATLYKYRAATRRVMPDVSRGATWYLEDTIAGAGMMTKWYSWVESPYDSLTYDLFHQDFFLYHKAHDDGAYNGDFFEMAVCTLNDYIRIVQRGDNDHNRGIVAQVV